MPRLLTLSRAARLVGARRGTLQKRIKNGELSTFEGMVSLTELLRAYPDAHIEDRAMLEKVEQIKDAALTKPMRELGMREDAGILAARVLSLGKELVKTRSELNRSSKLMGGLEDKLRHLQQDDSPQVRAAAGALASWVARALRERAEGTEEPEALLLRDTLLGIVAAHIHVAPSGHEFFVHGPDSLLEAGLSAGLNLRYGCRDGSCGLCKAKVLSGEVQRIGSQSYVFDDADAAHILMCRNTPVTDLAIDAAEASGPADIPAQTVQGEVRKLEWPSHAVAVLELRTPNASRFQFLAGQYATLQVANAPAERYPIASCPCDDGILQFHIRNVAGSDFAKHVAERLQIGDPVTVEGPSGDFILREDSLRSLVFVAYDTGFAAMKSLIEHGMALDVAEHLHLYWIATGTGGHYQHNLCRSWADALDNFQYTPLFLSGDNRERADTGEEIFIPRQRELKGHLDRIVTDHPDLTDHDFYVAGPEPVITLAEDFVREHRIPDGQYFLEPIPAAWSRQ